MTRTSSTTSTSTSDFHSCFGDANEADSQDSGELPESVCKLYDTLFSDLKIDDVLDQLDISETLRGGRKVGFYGPTSYRYGDYEHPARDYPDCEIFNTIFDRLSEEIDNEITRENYTCLEPKKALITLYSCL